jgi:hypothetical protein
MVCSLFFDIVSRVERCVGGGGWRRDRMKRPSKYDEGQGQNHAQAWLLMYKGER